MKTRPVDKIIHATAVSEGAGVTVHRTIGTSSLRNFDPFLMMDFFSSDDPDEYIAGFPDHPHRGFNTFTYMLDGKMLHQDSMGNTGELRSGGVQWMKAASGVIHSEMPQQEAGLMRGFQLWVNLPASEKMSTPSYQEFSSGAIPTTKVGDATIKVIAGNVGDTQGPVIDPHTNVQYLDISLNGGQSYTYPLPSKLKAFVYIFAGDAIIEQSTLPQHSFATLGDGDTVTVTAGTEATRFLLVAGRPINEPIVQHGPFVMNTQEEIKQAFDDYNSGRLVQNKAERVSA